MHGQSGNMLFDVFKESPKKRITGQGSRPARSHRSRSTNPGHSICRGCNPTETSSPSAAPLPRRDPIQRMRHRRPPLLVDHEYKEKFHHKLSIWVSRKMKYLVYPPEKDYNLKTKEIIISSYKIILNFPSAATLV